MSDAPKKSTARAVLLHHTVTFILIASLLALGVWGYLSYKSGKAFFSNKEPAPSPVLALQIQTQVERITLAGQIYYQLNDNYPTSLDTLVQDGLLSPDDLSYPNHSASYIVKVSDEKFVVHAENFSQSVKMPKTKKSETKKDKTQKPGKTKKPIKKKKKK